MRWSREIAAAVCAGALFASVFAGCASFGASPDTATFDCDRGFRSSDWNSRQRLKTGQSIVECGWLEKWSAQRVRTQLGRADFGTATTPEYALPGGVDAAKRLHGWLLKLEFDPQSHRLKSAKTDTMPI